MKDQNKIVGDNLRQLRNANSFSQEVVAKYLGIERSTYANYESGDREAPFDVLEKVSELFGCELGLLFEKDIDVVTSMLTTTFRSDDLSLQDMNAIANFKKIVMNYLKINTLLEK